MTGRLIHWLWAGSALLILAALWLLSSTAGSQLLLRLAADQSGGTLEIGKVLSGHLLSRIELDRIAIRTSGADVEIENLALEWSPLALLALRAQINTLSAERLRLTLRPPEGETDDDDRGGTPPERLPVNVVVRALSIQQLEIEGVEGAPTPITDLRLAMSWIGSQIKLQTLAVTLPDYGPIALQAEADLSQEAIEIRSLEAVSPFPLAAEGRYEYAGNFEATLDWRDARWPLLGEPQVESAKGTLSIEGRPEDYRLRLVSGVRTAQAAADLRLNGRGSTEHLDIESLRAEALDGTAQVSGELRWSPVLSADLQADIDRLNPAFLLPDWPGEISGRVTARGTAEAGEPIGFQIAIVDSVLREQRFSLTAEGRWQNEALHLASAELNQGVTRLSARGQGWPQLDLEALVESSDLSSLLPSLRGELSLQAQLRGEPRLPAITAEGSGRNLGWEDLLEVGELKLTTAFDPRGPLSLRLNARDLSGAAEIDRLQLSVDGRVDRHQLQLSATAPRGQLDVTLAGGATLDAQRWEGRLETASIAVPELPTVRLQASAPLQLSAERSALGESCWRSEDGERVDLCLEGEYQPSGSRLSADIRALDYALADPWMPTDFTLQGGLSGRVRAAAQPGQLPEVEVNLQSREGALVLRDRPALQLQAGEVQLSENRDGLTVNINLPTDEGGLRLQASAPPGAEWKARPLQGRFEARFDRLDWINRLSPDLQDLEGRLQADISASGTLGDPALEGAVELNLPQLFLIGAGVTLVDTVARLTATPDGQGRIEARTRAGEGTLEVDGELFIDAAAPTATLRIRGENAQLVDTPDARIWLAPDLTVAYAENRLDVGGRIDVPRAEITPRGGEGSGQGTTSDQIVVRDGEIASGGGDGVQIHADVTLALGKDVRFKGFGLTSRFSGQLRAQQQPGRPATGRGEIRLIDGRFKAYGQDLRIDTGRLLFSGGPLTDPAVEIRATRTPREDITVGVLVRGRLDRPEFSLFSTPAMPQDEQLGWLVLGRPITSATGEGGDQAALANAALSLGLSGSDFIAQRLKGGLRIDDISIGARPGEDPDQARLTLGKYLTPSLYVSYGVGLFQPGHVFRLLYDIGRGFKLQTETGVASGADLLYTIER